MKLEHEFYKLPLCFDVERLKHELSCFRESDWEKHPSDYKGNLAIPLVSVNGEINDGFAGPMKMTRFLKQSPYMQQVLAAFNSVLSRSRLMRLEGRHDVPLHSDINAHWWSRVRIHVPIVTTPDVIFHCGDQQVHMAPGDAWIFDAWKMHRVVNPSGNTRVHLVIDTAGSPEFWEIIGRSEVFSSSRDNRVHAEVEPELLPFESTGKVRIETERFNMPVVMSAGEVDALVEGIVSDVRSVQENSAVSIADFTRIVDFFRFKWRSVWSVHGAEKTGWLDYESLIARTNRELFEITSPQMSNESVASEVMNGRVVSVAFNPGLYGVNQPVSAANSRQPGPESSSEASPQPAVGRNSPCPCGSGKKYKRCHGQ